jgi:hypothetical protein
MTTVITLLVVCAILGAVAWIYHRLLGPNPGEDAPNFFDGFFRSTDRRDRERPFDDH